MRSNRFLILLSLLTCFICIISTSCGNKSQKSLEDTKNPPLALQKMEENIDKIIETLDTEGKLDTANNEPNQPSPEVEKKEKQSNQDEQSKDKEGGSSKEDNSSSNSEQSDSQKSKPQKSPWTEVESTIKELLKNWNKFEPIGIKDGIDPKSAEEFNGYFDVLTKNIIDKNIMTTLNNSNDVYKFIPEFLTNYDSKNVNVKRLKFYVRDIMYKSRYEKWDIATISMDNAVNLLSSIKSQSGDELKEVFETLKYSVTNLKKVVSEKDNKLTQLRGNIVLENIKNMEKQIKKQEEENKKENK